MTDWNRDGRIDATDTAIDYMIYSKAMNGARKPVANHASPKRAEQKISPGAIIAVIIVGVIAALLNLR